MKLLKAGSMKKTKQEFDTVICTLSGKGFEEGKEYVQLGWNNGLKVLREDDEGGIFILECWTGELDDEIRGDVIAFSEDNSPRFTLLSHETDNINPAHYKDQCSIECIEAMEMAYGSEAVLHFCICNAFKYLWRHGNKNGLEDLDKASWYMDKAGTEARMISNAERYDAQMDAIKETIRRYKR